MTLVRNRLLRLSGNSLLIATVCLGLMSCDLLSGVAKRPAADPEVVYEDEIFAIDKIPVEKEVSDKTEKAIEAEETIVFFHDMEYKVAPHKEHFNIALILPFYYRANSDYERAYSNIMLEYYQGLEMALNDLKNQGFKTKLYVFDNRNDTNELKEILQKDHFMEMDLIVGPVNVEHLDIVSRYSIQTGTPVFSPFTGVNECPENNPILYSYIPGFKLKARLMVDFIEKNYQDNKLIILRDRGYLDENFVPYLIKELEERKTIFYMREAHSRNNRWPVLLSEDSMNVVYIPSESKSVVHSSIGGIFASKREVTIIGEKGWADFEDNDYNFWTRTNVHLMAYDFVDNQDTGVMEFKLRFREENFEDPSTYAFMGYDQMKFIGDFLMAFGERFPLYISEKEFSYLSARYRFIYENGCNENATLYFLKYQDNHLIPVK